MTRKNMTTDKKQFNVRLSDRARMALRGLKKLWNKEYKTEVVEKALLDAYQRETK
jgi:hypothetical protein